MRFLPLSLSRQTYERGAHGAAILCVLIALSACGSTGDGDDTDDATGGTSGDGDSVAPFEACEFGDDADKCDGDANVACTPVPEETGDECNRDSECEDGALCFESMDASASAGECLRIVGRCLPIEEPAEGDRFGESCTVGQDSCAGSCVAIDGDEGECEEHCRVGASSGCGQADLEGSGVACAFFAYDLSDIDAEQGEGDLGVCAHLCNCADDCPGDQWCLSQPTGEFGGVCTGGVSGEEALHCRDGLGGAGGMNGQ